jgi:hypothetical protein
MPELIYCAKILLVWFLSLQVIGVCVNLGDRKEVRMPWKDLFLRTCRHSVLMLVAGLVIGGLVYLLLKR